MTAEPDFIPKFDSGAGEMVERIRSHNWADTPLGALAEWPSNLRTCVRIMLSSQQPIWIGWGEQLIKLYNDPYIDIVRGKHPTALGQPASVVWKDIWKDIEPLLSKAMTKDEGTYVQSQLLIMERSGFPEETYYTFSYTPVLGDDGKPAGIICYNTADTEKIYSQRALKTLQQFDMLAQKKSEIEVYQQATRALEVNNFDFPFSLIYKITQPGREARLVASSGFETSLPQPETIVDFLNPGTRMGNIAKAITENELIVSENDGSWGDLPKGPWNVMPSKYVHLPIRGVNKKQVLGLLTVGLNPYRAFDDSYRNFLQSITDQISMGVNNIRAYEEERKRAQALEELDKAKTLFFTNISHEFRTPITLMLGPLEDLMINQRSTLSAEAHEKLQVTHRHTIRLLKLVNNLLDFSRIESGRHKGQFALTDIALYTKNLAANFRAVIESAGLIFSVDTEDNIPPVYVDRQMWEKVVFNLLSNAFKYTLTGSIAVRLKAGRQLLLVVEDSGLGIPAKELPLMFDRFHRVDNAGGRTFEGTGIGLSLIKELILMHKGNISVESEVGKGSKFTVTLPFGKDHLPVNQVKDKPGSGDFTEEIYVDGVAHLLEGQSSVDMDSSKAIEFSESKETVLIVDDNADMRKHIQAVVENRYNTLMAGNGIEALALLGKHSVALILCDIMMPVMDGIELLKKVKENPATSYIPVVLITARAGEESRIDGYELGADDYLVKPFSGNELLARIKSQIRVAKTRQKIEESEVKFRTLAETLPQLIWITDSDGSLEYASGRWRAYTGIEPTGADSWKQMLHPDDYTANMTEWAGVLQTSGKYNMEVRLKNLNNEYRWHYCQGVPVHNTAGVVTRWIGSLTDIHDQKLFTERLEQVVNERTMELMVKNDELVAAIEKEKDLTIKNIRKNEFILMASHELKTPITSIQGYVQLLLEKINPNGNPERNDFTLLPIALRSIEKQTKNLTRLISELLDLVRIEQGALLLHKTDLSFASVVQESVEHLRHVSKKSIQLTINADGIVHVDANRISQVLVNLMGNAIKYSPYSERIEVEIFKKDEQTISISIRDFGIGISAEEFDRIFERFYRVEGEREGTFPGFGIGLFIAKDITEKHRGVIAVQSERNKGSIFTVTLPLKNANQ
jgi:PAS domain S-box-containing protein